MPRLFTAIACLLPLLSVVTIDVSADTQRQHMLQQGDAVGVFYVTKVAGAEDDGVEPGEDLCYRCRYGSSPLVMIFARQTDGKVTELVHQIDRAVTEHQDSKLRGLLTLMGENVSQLRSEAKRIADEGFIKKVPIAIAKDVVTGPRNYRLPNEVPVTIVIAKDSQVVSTHVFTTDKIDFSAVMTDVQRILD